MCKPLSFASFHSDRHFSRNLWYSFGLALFVIFSCLLFFAPSVHGAQTHGCAPDMPPPVAGPLNTTATVQINEVLTQPNSKWNCTGTSNSWIELYNSQSQPIDLYAQHTLISINAEQGSGNIYFLPFGTAIAAKGFLVLFPLEHVNATSIGSVALIMNNNPVDQVSVPSLQADQSYARTPDGTGAWQVVDQPTIDASNALSSQTATPTTAITPTHTPKPTRTPKGGNSNSGSTPASTGTQPAWKQVQLPPGMTPTDTAATSADTSTPLSSLPQSPSVAQSGGSSGWQIALIVTFILLLLGILTWCWRLFRAP